MCIYKIGGHVYLFRSTLLSFASLHLSHYSVHTGTNPPYFISGLIDYYPFRHSMLVTPFFTRTAEDQREENTILSTLITKLNNGDHLPIPHLPPHRCCHRRGVLVRLQRGLHGPSDRKNRVSTRALPVLSAFPSTIITERQIPPPFSCTAPSFLILPVQQGRLRHDGVLERTNHEGKLFLNIVST